MSDAGDRGATPKASRPGLPARPRGRERHAARGSTVAHGQPVWASQAECCRPGLGAFQRGCSTTLF